MLMPPWQRVARATATMARYQLLPVWSKIQPTGKGLKACWSWDGIHQIPGRFCLEQAVGQRGGRGCRLVGLQRARLESAPTRLVPKAFSRKLSWKSGSESGSAAVVVPQHAA